MLRQRVRVVEHAERARFFGWSRCDASVTPAFSLENAYKFNLLLLIFSNGLFAIISKYRLMT